MNMSYYWLQDVDMITGEGGVCPGVDWLPHGRRCYRKEAQPMAFATCARTCAVQHGATLVKIFIDPVRAQRLLFSPCFPWFPFSPFFSP